MNASPSFFGTGGEPVPAVDAEDLQTVYDVETELLKEIERQAMQR
jgi:hypothetical protein